MDNGNLVYIRLYHLDKALDDLFDFLVDSNCPDKKLFAAVCSSSLRIHSMRELYEYRLDVCKSGSDSK